MKRRTVLASLVGGAGMSALLAAGTRPPVMLAANGRQSESARPADSHCAGYVEVDTESGRLRGQSSQGIISFKGVPYGSSTHETNRFLPPVPIKPWTGTRDALEYGPIAPQENVAEKVQIFSAGGFDGVIPLHKEGASEDCLRLNVWTPGLDTAGRRPVMVWLHGGSFIGGSGNASWYNGRNLSRRGDAVVITVNHRLGALGCMYLGERFGETMASSGLLVMLDIILALKWVQANIARFGGNPQNVTIFGESGGGSKVSALLAMPGAKGLFHKAIIQSGAGVRMHTPEQASRVTDLMISELGLARPTLQTLQSIPIDPLIAAQQRVVKRVRGGELPGVATEFRPVLDGRHLPQHPFDPVAPAISAHVPLLIGTNETDASWGIWRDVHASPIGTDPDVVARLSRSHGERAEDIVRTYRQLYPSLSAQDLYIRIKSSPHMSITIAERKSALSAPVFMFLFAWATPAYGGELGSPHMLDVPLVFDNVQAANLFTGGGGDAVRMAAILSEAWANFARNGIPSSSRLPAWPAYDVTTRETMILDNEFRVVSDPGSAARKFWLSGS